MEDVYDPHNLGAISRSCDAFGIQQINVIFETQPAFDPKEVGKNSSTATNKWLDYRIHHGTETALQALKDGRLGAGRGGARSQIPNPSSKPTSACPASPCFLATRRPDCRRRRWRLADRKVTIPMRGIAQSMNVSVSAALCIYEVTRQRLTRCPEVLRMEPAEIAQTLDYFLQMHEQLSKRNKKRRVERARARRSKRDNSNL